MATDSQAWFGDESSEHLKPPGFAMLLAEARGFLEFNASLVLAPVLLNAPRGDGHPVFVLPGLLAGDLSMAPLRRLLGHLGYDVFPWGLGRNLGGIYRMRSRLRERLAEIHARSARKVTLVGWSLGGVYARDLALFAPGMVRGVVTLGSPFSGDVTATNARRVYEALSGERIADIDPADRAALAGDLPVPASSIYTRGDGVVNWRTCLGRPSGRAENIEVQFASHLGLVVNAAVLWAIADRLAQPEGQFRPFARSGPFAFAYPPPPDVPL